MAATADIGLVGLAVMGENLVLNMLNHGFTVAVYNRTTSKALPPPTRTTRVTPSAIINVYFIKIHYLQMRGGAFITLLLLLFPPHRE